MPVAAKIRGRRLVDKREDDSRRLATIALQETAEPLVALDFAVAWCTFERKTIQRNVADALMRAFLEIMINEIRDQVSQVPSAEDRKVTQTFGLERLHASALIGDMTGGRG